MFSASMLIVTASVGWLIGWVGAGAVLPALTLACVFALVAMFCLPREETRRASDTGGGGKLRLFVSSDWFPLFIISTMLIQGSHGALYAFGSLSWRAHGISSGAIGALWALSVIAEIAFFAVGRRFVERFSSADVIALGGALAAIRWLLLADFPGSIVVAALSQTFHAVTFSASHLAAMRLIATHVDDKNSASAQGIYSSVIMGIGMGLFIFASGPFYELFGAKVFDVMAATAALGALLAVALKRRRFTYIDEVASPAG